MARKLCTLKLDEWENPALIGETLPTPGERVIIRVVDQQVVIMPVFETDKLPGDVAYVWPRSKTRHETAALAWKHLEHRMRQARATHHYPCCGGTAIFHPTWLALALDDYVVLADERICPACNRYWTVEATVEDDQVKEVVWLYKSPPKRR